MTPDDKLKDEITHQSLNLFRLSAAEAAKTVKRLKAMERKLIAELSQPLLTEGNKRDIAAIIASTEEIISDYYSGISDQLEQSKLAETVAARTAKSLTVALGAEASEMPTQAFFKSVASDVLIQGSPARAWWEKQSEDTAFKVASEVRRGLANDETNQQIVARIVGKGGQPGVIPIARRNAASIVQTSVQAVANDARLETFRQNSDVINGLEQISTLDSHTSDICIAYAGATWDLDGNPLNGSPDFNGGCPRHFNCRSVIVPITKSFKELGIDIGETKRTTRASADGPISDKTSFDAFLDRKGEAYQDEMLGKGRADMWREGKITLRDLVNGQGRPLTLSELQSKFD